MNANDLRAVKFRRIARAGGGDDLLLASGQIGLRERGRQRRQRTRGKKNFFHARDYVGFRKIVAAVEWAAHAPRVRR